MTELKKGRWVKVYEQGKANSAEENDNVMDITLGENRAQAEVTYTVRTHRKAASWLIKYLEAANAVDVLAAAAERILAEVSDEDVALNGDTWTCEIEKMDQGVFKVRMNWTEPDGVELQAPQKKKRSKKVAAEPVPA